MTSTAMTPMQRQILEFLLSRAFVRQEQMYNFLWGDSIDGGPDDPRKTMSVHMVYLRRLLQPAGVVIETRRGVGWRIPDQCKQTARAVLAADDGNGWSGVCDAAAVAA